MVRVAPARVAALVISEVCDVTMSAPRSRSDRLRALADELISLADALEQAWSSVARADMLIAEGERIARAIWAVFRG